MLSEGKHGELDYKTNLPDVGETFYMDARFDGDVEFLIEKLTKFWAPMRAEALIQIDYSTPNEVTVTTHCKQDDRLDSISGTLLHWPDHSDHSVVVQVSRKQNVDAYGSEPSVNIGGRVAQAVNGLIEHLSRRRPGAPR